MATTSAAESPRAAGRSDPGAARARTEELYRRHGRLVGGLCQGLLRDRTEAEDAAQQVFLSAHRSLLNGSEPREPAAWLATIARNECVARIRHRMRTPLPTEEVEQASGLPDPLTEAIRRVDLAALWQAIRELPVQQRDALLLREFGGLSYAELGAALAVSGPAVESLLFRARHGLRAKLEAAYAALSGASGLDWLARLLAGGSGAAAPVAAKVVALGVGAAVITGGAVVGPQVFRSQAHRPAVLHRQAAPAARPDAASPPAAGLAGVFAIAPTVERGAGASSEGGDHGSGSSSSGGGDQGSSSAGASSEGGDHGSGSSSSGGGDQGSSSAGASSEGGDHGSGSSSSGGGDQGSSSAGASSEGGDHGSGSSS
ncbi:MAG: RNA polymerase sigma factor, partial [Gaiellaceae bacterium]